MGVCVDPLCFGGALDLLDFHFRWISKNWTEISSFASACSLEAVPQRVDMRSRCHLAAGRGINVAMTTKDAMRLLEREQWGGVLPMLV